MQLLHAYLISALSGNILAFNVCARCAVAVGNISLRLRDLKKKKVFIDSIYFAYESTR